MVLEPSWNLLRDYWNLFKDHLNLLKNFWGPLKAPYSFHNQLPEVLGVLVEVLNNPELSQWPLEHSQNHPLTPQGPSEPAQGLMEPTQGSLESPLKHTELPQWVLRPLQEPPFLQALKTFLWTPGTSPRNLKLT